MEGCGEAKELCWHALFPGSEPLQDSLRKLIPNVQTIPGSVTHAVTPTQFEHCYSARHHFTCGYTHSLNAVTLSDTTSPVFTHIVWTLLHCQTPLHLWLHTQFQHCYTVRHHFTRHYKYSLNAVRHRFTCHYTYSLNADRVRHHFTYGYTYSPNAFTLSRHHSPEVTHKFECCYRHHFTWGDISMLHCCH